MGDHGASVLRMGQWRWLGGGFPPTVLAQLVCVGRWEGGSGSLPASFGHGDPGAGMDLNPWEK